jgi:hypothetical protein
MSDLPDSTQALDAPRDPGANVGIGLYNDAARSGFSAAEIIAIALTLIWLVGCGVFFLVLGSEGTDPIRMVMTILAVFMPVAVIWVAAAAARSARIMREESERLHIAIDAMRHTYMVHQQSGALGKTAAAVERKLDALAHAQRKTESAIATFTTSRPTSLPTPPRVINPPEAQERVGDVGDQPVLALGTPAEELAPPLSTDDFIQAMHFPENAEDQDGFRALRRALQDHKISGLISAAQDVLTLLSQDGIYMDDLRPDMARPEIWRKFAAGERGRAVAPLGGVHDRSSLALTAGRMRKDPVFRDAAHHFLRIFDKIFADFEKTATDQNLADLAETRSARAFMLLGRVTGTFD